MTSKPGRLLVLLCAVVLTIIAYPTALLVRQNAGISSPFDHLSSEVAEGCPASHLVTLPVLIRSSFVPLSSLEPSSRVRRRPDYASSCCLVSPMGRLSSSGGALTGFSLSVRQ